MQAPQIYTYYIGSDKGAWPKAEVTRLNYDGALGIATAYLPVGAHVLRPPPITTPRRHEHLHISSRSLSRRAQIAADIQ
jgi:hypothetical protein